MTREEIWVGVEQLLVERLQKRPREGPATLVSDLELDSVGLLSLVVELENRFRICFEPGEEQGITTLTQVIDLVESRLQEKGT